MTRVLKSWNDLSNVLNVYRIQVVAVDLRGTLVSPPRDGNLARAFQGMAPDDALARWTRRCRTTSYEPTKQTCRSQIGPW